MSLFSSLVPSPVKIALENKLLMVKPHEHIHAPFHRYGTGFGKPTFPKNISLSTTLADLVTEDSWFIFTLLQLDDDTFLNNEVESWPSNVAFNSALENTAAINVVNDCAERGVKLSSDFITAARSENHYQHILQVVEEDRPSKSTKVETSVIISEHLEYSCKGNYCFTRIFLIVYPVYLCSRLLMKSKCI